MARSIRSLLVKIAILLGACLFGFGAAFVYFGDFGGKEDMVYAETYYDSSVSGLSVGSPVNLRGVRIGEVAAIDFVGNHYAVRDGANHLVYVKMAFPRRNLCSHEDEGVAADRLLAHLVESQALRATVSASGITGESHIELDIGSQVSAKEIAWIPETTYIPPAVSLMDNFAISAAKVMNQINKMDVTSVWSNMNVSVQALAKTTENVQTMMETRQADVEKIAGDISEAVTAIRELATEVRERPSLLFNDRPRDPLPETEAEIEVGR